jgi:hypothetical protein
MWYIHSAYCVFCNLLLRRSVELAEHVARIGETIDAYKMLFGRLGGKNLRGIPRRRRDLEKIVCDIAH